MSYLVSINGYESYRKRDDLNKGNHCKLIGNRFLIVYLIAKELCVEGVQRFGHGGDVVLKSRLIPTPIFIQIMRSLH